MTNDRTPREQAKDQADLLRRIETSLSGMGADDARTILQGLLAASGPPADPGALTPPSQRRPRRGDVVTYRVRVDLQGTKPPLWRRLELASDLFLDDVHDIIQAAFGWTDSHLHRFGSGPSFYSPETEYYLGDFDADLGEPGIPEGEVRLDEVLVDVGDKLFYAYDFGDDWEHVIRAESVLTRNDEAPRVICTGGKRPGPAEDCGGVHGYELYAAANNPSDRNHRAAIAEIDRIYGEEIDVTWFEPTPFDVDQINEKLADLGLDEAAHGGELPDPLADLVGAVRDPAGQRRLRTLIHEAFIEGDVHVDPATAERMVQPYAWLLERVGDDGIKLTGAGYLPPTHVEATMSELGLEDTWVGKHNREDQTLPVQHLRTSAQAMGLLRKYKGTLRLTSRARAMRDDPVALWWHLAENMPLKSKDRAEEQGGLLYLVAVAAEVSGDGRRIVADLLTGIGWVRSDDTPLTTSDAASITFGTATVLRRIGGTALLGDAHRTESLQPDGVAFARAALRTWPG